MRWTPKPPKRYHRAFALIPRYCIDIKQYVWLECYFFKFGPDDGWGPPITYAYAEIPDAQKDS
jgi:hypothetical protein